MLLTSSGKKELTNLTFKVLNMAKEFGRYSCVFLVNATLMAAIAICQWFGEF